MGSLEVCGVGAVEEWGRWLVGSSVRSFVRSFGFARSVVRGLGGAVGLVGLDPCACALCLLCRLLSGRSGVFMGETVSRIPFSLLLWLLLCCGFDRVGGGWGGGGGALVSGSVWCETEERGRERGLLDVRLAACR